MSEQANQLNPTLMGYGFEDDNIKQSTFHFGGNFGTCKMTKFEWNDMCGKKGEDGKPTAGEALDIVFNIGGTDKNYRMFPVTKAFDENQQEVTDPIHPAFITAQKTFNQICVQILKCYVDENDIKAALAKRISSFKEYCGILMKMLPKNFQEKPLDIFMQWGWSISGENNRTYLEIPKKVSYGKFLVAAITPASGNWHEIKNDKELYYVDATEEQVKSNPTLLTTGIKHPFVRNEWFMSSNFAKQQKEESADNALNSGTTGSTPAATTGGTAW